MRLVSRMFQKNQCALNFEKWYLRITQTSQTGFLKCFTFGITSVIAKSWNFFQAASYLRNKKKNNGLWSNAYNVSTSKCIGNANWDDVVDVFLFFFVCVQKFLHQKLVQGLIWTIFYKKNRSNFFVEQLVLRKMQCLIPPSLT